MTVASLSQVCQVPIDVAHIVDHAAPKLTSCSRPPAAFVFYALFAITVIVFLIYYVAPTHGTTNIFVYLGICSLAGSLSVMSCKVRGSCRCLHMTSAL